MGTAISSANNSRSRYAVQSNQIIPRLSSKSLLKRRASQSPYVEFRMTYMSKACTLLDRKDVQEIVKKSQINNRKYGVTGALLYFEAEGMLQQGHFIQTLEGNRTEVNLIYNRIKEDKRHTDVVILHSQLAPPGTCGLQREFNEWSMQEVNLTTQKDQVSASLRHMLSTVQKSHNMLRAFTQSSLMDSISKGENPRTVPPRKVRIVTLMCDIVSFSSLSEMIPIGILHKVINFFYETITDSVRKYGGEVSKFLGDGVSVTFECNPSNPSEAAANAVRAARWAYRRLKPAREENIFPYLHCGFGLSEGEVIRGTFGSLNSRRGKLDFSHIGNSCIVAESLESLTRETSAAILFDESIYNSVRNRFRDLDFITRHHVKGIKSPVRVYGITSDEFKLERPDLSTYSATAMSDAGSRDQRMMMPNSVPSNTSAGDEHAIQGVVCV